jgi:phosphatidylinositol glycan class M
MRKAILLHALAALLLRCCIVFAVAFVERHPTLTAFTYTDIDYTIFSDGALLSFRGGSPFDRRTYRYTPYLADLLSFLVDPSDPGDPLGVRGKLLFCLADVACGLLIYRILLQTSERGAALSTTNMFWLYNPLAVNICTRGSAEALLPLLPVLLTVALLLRKERGPSHLLLAGLCHGVSVHGKIYPVIYSIAYLVHISPRSLHPRRGQSFVSLLAPRRLLAIFFQPAALLFTAASLLTFAFLTYTAHVSHPLFLPNGLLYHLGRVDHRHNYSPFFYPIYLLYPAPGEPASAMLKLLSGLSFVPQVLLLLHTSLSLAAGDLCFAMFLQSFM